MEDSIIDLTTSPDAQIDGRPYATVLPVACKRQREHDENFDCDEEEARQRIMHHARRVNQHRGLAAEPLAEQGKASQQQHQQASDEHTAQETTTVALADADWTGRRAEAGAAPAAAPGSNAARPQPITNSLLAELHAARLTRMAARGQQHPHAGFIPAMEPPQDCSSQSQQVAAEHPRQQGQPSAPADLRLLTYNVWFREDIHVQQRMAAIGGVIAARQPHFVCLQEVTPLIYQLFSRMAWWGEYSASSCPHGAPYFTVLLWHHSVRGVRECTTLPFANSIMGRDLKVVAGEVGGCRVTVATSHLESPTGWDQMYSRQRVAQCKQAIELLDRVPGGDVLFAGDMNWGPDDGLPPLAGGWSDAWLHAHPGDPGLTYDPKANPMLKPNNRIRRRLDRVFARLAHWRLHSLELVGRAALPGLQHEGRPVLPSDHFGLLLVLRSG